jgi:hypothetical protein
MKKAREWKDDRTKRDLDRESIEDKTYGEEEEAQVCQTRKLEIRTAEGELEKPSRSG